MTALHKFIAARLADDLHYVDVMTRAGEQLVRDGLPPGQGDVLVEISARVLANPEVTELVMNYAPLRFPNDLQRLAAVAQVHRQILALHHPAGVWCGGCRRSVLCANIRALGTIWSAHADYQPCWAPVPMRVLS